MPNSNTGYFTHNLFPKGDARNDAGYGRTRLKFTKPRTRGSAYPYTMTDEESEQSDELEDIDIEDVPAEFDTKVHRFLPVNDFYAAAGTDPFYFAGGATKMSEELGKYVTSAGGIGVTKPAGIGSSTSGFRTNIRPTGTKKGWSSAPESSEDTPPKYRLADFIDDDKNTVRKFIRAVLSKND